MKRRVVVALLVALSADASAQETLLPSTAWGLATVVSGWHFPTPLGKDIGAIRDVAQAAVPFQVRAVFGGRWSFDLTGAYASAAIRSTKADSGSGQGSSDHITFLNGPTDVKLRMSGPLAGDKLVLTAGVNLPTGTTGLSVDQTAVLQSVGAPALHMPIPAYGTGTGGTLGLIGVVQPGTWAFAFGASVEQRTEYTPIALVIAGGGSDTHLTPGTAAHLSIGADGVVGSDRLSILLLGDAYGTDKVVVLGGGTQTGSTQYQLGPQYTALTQLDFGGGAWSEGALALSVRYRSAFKGPEGNQVSGSDGTYLDGSIGGVLGGGSRAGLVLGLNGSWQSGLRFTTALVGAASTVGGATLGFELPTGVRFAIHPQYGTFDRGAARTTGFGGSLVLSFFARREPR